MHYITCQHYFLLYSGQCHLFQQIRSIGKTLAGAECVKSHPEFKLKKINIEFTRRTPQVLQPIHVSIERNETTPQQQLTVTNIPLHIKKDY